MAVPEIKIEKELAEGRVFIAAHGMQVDVHVTDDGITVQITKGNDVIDEAYADAEN
jgi:hypothetical protein